MGTVREAARPLDLFDNAYPEIFALPIRTEFDCILHIDMAAAGADLAKIRDKLAGRKSLWTGPSSVYHMCGDDPQTTRQAVQQLFDLLGKRGFILTPSPSIHSIMPWQNLVAMIDQMFVIGQHSTKAGQYPAPAQSPPVLDYHSGLSVRLAE